MRLSLVFLLLTLFSFSTNLVSAQTSKVDTSYWNGEIPPDSKYEEMFSHMLNRANLTFNMPPGFSNVGISKADNGKFYNTRHHQIINFFKVIINKDSTLAIGLTILNRSPDLKGDLFFEDIAKSGFKAMVDTVHSTYRHLDKNIIARKYRATYGLEFSAKNAMKFMDRFTNHRFIYIAQAEFQISMVYFYIDQHLTDINSYIDSNYKMLELKK